MVQEFCISGLSHLTKVADAIIELILKYPVVVLDGEMGAGKTTLTRSLCSQMSVEDEVSSPTYGIVNSYHSEKFGAIHHFDFYRIEDEMEAVESGLDEIIDSGEICFIEWAERIPKLLPENYVRVTIELNEDESRQFKISVQ